MGVSDYLLNFADVIQSISNMVTEVNSKNQLVERNFKRNEMLAEYFFGLSKWYAAVLELVHCRHCLQVRQWE